MSKSAQRVGWVERSGAHHPRATVGLAPLDPPYGRTREQPWELACRRMPRKRHHRRLAIFLIVLTAAAGCERSAAPGPAPPNPSAASVAVEIVKPIPGTIRRTISQPAAIQAFEQTPIYAKIPGYVLKWEVDIGDIVKKDQLLAELWTPELVSELKLRKEEVALAAKGLAMAEAQIASAKAQIKEAEAALSKAEAAHDYWKGQNEQFAKLVNQSVLDKQSKDDAHNQFRMAAAALNEAQAKIVSAKAALLERQAGRDKAEAAIRAAEAARERQADFVRYATFLAPFDGVVTRRTVNTFDFVQPPGAGKSEPMYVVERRDKMRVFVEVPEADAPWAAKGTPARVRVPALAGREFTGKIDRTSYAVDKSTRTLLVEIDLPNPSDELRPGMYAHAQIDAERKALWTLPVAAIATDGDVNVGFQAYCFLIVDGRARRTPITVGGRDDRRVEVVTKQGPAGWQAFSGEEQVVRGDPSRLKDGQAVEARPAQK